MRILNGRLRALTEEILVFSIGVRLWAVVADERWSHMEARRRLFLPLSYGSYPPRPFHRRHWLRKSRWFKPPVPLLEIPNSGSSIVCTLMVNKPLNWALKKMWFGPTLLVAPPPKQYSTPRQSHSHANRLVIWWNGTTLGGKYINFLFGYFL